MQADGREDLGYVRAEIASCSAPCELDGLLRRRHVGADADNPADPCGTGTGELRAQCRVERRVLFFLSEVALLVVKKRVEPHDRVDHRGSSVLAAREEGLALLYEDPAGVTTPAAVGRQPPVAR